MDIYYKNVYTTTAGKNVLVLYSISKRHFIGIPLHRDDTKDNDSILIPSLKNFYYRVLESSEYKYSDFSNNLYISGKKIQINNNDFKNIISNIKKHLITMIELNAKETKIDNYIYIKWTNDIFKLNLKDDIAEDYYIKPRAIYWVDFGFGIGSELRKIRPAIVWRHTADKKVCTFIPISSSCHSDNFYFHCDLKCMNYSTAKVECMQNFSNKRIIEPFKYKGKVLYINNDDYNLISQTIKEYYTYESEPSKGKNIEIIEK